MRIIPNRPDIDLEISGDSSYPYLFLSCKDNVFNTYLTSEYIQHEIRLLLQNKKIKYTDVRNTAQSYNGHSKSYVFCITFNSEEYFTLCKLMVK